MAKQLDMKALAELGAAARITELKAEIDAIRQVFPALRNGRARPNGRATSTKAARAPRRRRRRGMSEEQRKAVSARMKKYWATRRKAKGAGVKRAAPGK